MTHTQLEQTDQQKHKQKIVLWNKTQHDIINTIINTPNLDTSGIPHALNSLLIDHLKAKDFESADLLFETIQQKKIPLIAKTYITMVNHKYKQFETSNVRDQGIIKSQLKHLFNDAIKNNIIRPSVLTTYPNTNQTTLSLRACDILTEPAFKSTFDTNLGNSPKIYQVKPTRVCQVQYHVIRESYNNRNVT